MKPPRLEKTSNVRDPTWAGLSCNSLMSTSSGLEPDEDLLRKSAEVGSELAKENRCLSLKEFRKP